MPPEPLGQLIERLCREARTELVLCAPFAKLGVVDRLLDAVAHDTVAPLLITRWRPEEVAAGVSDTAVLGALEARGGRVLLHDQLHAKYYRTEAVALLGSANLTGTALGWRWPSNLELLAPAPLVDVTALERRLLLEGIVATRELAAEVELQAAKLGLPKPLPEGLVLVASDAMWVPALRYPQDLFGAYVGGPYELSSASANAAARDLLVLDLPTGLSRETFDKEVGERLWQSEMVRELSPLLATPRRFGALAREVETRLGLPREDANAVWQTLMRWLLIFCPNRVELQVSHVSEMLVLRGLVDGE